MKSKIFLTLALIISSYISFGQYLTDTDILKNISYNDCLKHEKPIKGNSAKSIGDNYDAIYIRFNWYINPDTNYIKGSATSYFKTTANNVSKITMELNNLLTIDSIKYHNVNVSFFHGGNDSVNINLGTVLAINTLDSVSIYYQGSPNNGGGFFNSFSKGYHNGVPIIYTLSEPYGAKDWWPCKNDNRDKIDSIDLIITCPQNVYPYRPGTNGLLLSETTNGINKTFHWKHKYPIAPYLIGISVTNYAQYIVKSPYGAGNLDTINTLNYIYPEHMSTWKWGVDEISGMMHIFDSLFGTYPFDKEKYGQAEWEAHGGMEHQTMTFIGAGEYVSTEVEAHELAHQWFGDKITNANWQEIWLNEGVTTYCAGLWYEYVVQNKYWWWVYKKISVQEVTSEPGGSVFCYDTTDVGRVFSSRLSYRKGCMVMHMLRLKIGDSAFFAGMYNYINDPNLIYKTAVTNDLKNHFEATCNCDLTSFFDKWIYKEGYPIYDVHCIYEPVNQDIFVTLDQSTSHPSVSFFDLKVPMTFKTTNNTIVQKVLLDNTMNGQTFQVHLGFVPDSAIFDADWEIIHVTNSITLGVDEIPSTAADISIFPNPVLNKIIINGGNNLITKIEIYDVTGNKTGELLPSSNGPIEFDIADYAQGVYFLRVYNLNSIYTKKIVKL
jgi:aminopeptidase N